MKKLYLLLFTIILTATTSFGQIILNEGFEGNYMPPAGWSATSVCPDASWLGWMRSSTAHEGNYSAFVDYSPFQSQHSSYLITPLLSINGHKLVSFWYAVSYPEYTSSTSFTLEVSTTGTEPEDFTVLQTISFPTHYNFVNLVYDLQAYSGEDIYLAFHIEDDYGTGVYIDEVMVFDQPACMAPDSLTTVSTDYNSANFTWAEIPDAMGYQVQCIPTDGDWSNAIVGSSFSNFITINGLSSSTDYYARVRTICGVADTSDWSNTVPFSTLCEALTLAQGAFWAENFESISASGVVDLNSCWATPLMSTTYDAPYIYCGLAIASHSGDNSLELRGNSGESNIVVLPAFTNDLSTLKLKFFANTTAPSSTTAGTLQVGYITDPNDPSTFTPIETVTPKAESYSRAQSAPYGPYYFAPYNATGRIAIRFISNAFSTSWNLDDITVGALADCAEPIQLQATNITSTSADLTWIHMDGYLYEVLMWPSGTQDTVHYTGISLDNGPCHIDSLVPSTAYTWLARTICGSNSTAPSEINGHFTTPNVTLTLPYLCDFEDTSHEYDEFTFSGYGTSQWRIGSATSAPSTDGSPSLRSLYISDNNGLSNNYSGSSYSYAYASLDLNFPNTAMEYHLEFDLKGVGECGWDDLSVYLLDGGTALPNSGAPNGVALVTQACGLTSWTHYNVVLPDVTGTSKKVVFYWRNDNYIFGNPPAAIDNIYINGTSCARPTHLTASDVTDESVTLTWKENANATSWTVNYKLLGNESTVYQQIPVTDTVYVLNNLLPNTSYVCYVTADCEEGQSNHSNPVTFRTLCSVNGISVLPYNEDFSAYETVDGSDYVPCWSRLNSNPARFAYVNHTDFESSCLDFHYTPNCYTMAILPMINSSIPLNTVMLSMYVRRQSLTSGSLVVGAITDPNDASTFETIDTIHLNVTNEWVNISVFCNEYTGNAQYLAIKTQNAGYSSVLIDNLTLNYLPGCLPPTGVTVSNITTNSANIDWFGNANSYQVYVVGNPDTMVYTTSNTHIVIDDLEPSSSYSIFVQSLCENDTSTLTSRISFHTNCDAITITENNPWMESFENYSGITEAIPVSPCWGIPTKDSISGVVFPTVYSSSLASHSGHYSLEVKGNNNLFVLPAFTNEINTLRISMWGNTTASDSITSGTLELGVVTDPNNPLTFSAVATVPATAFNRTGSDAHSTNFMGPFDLSSVTPQQGQRIAFRYINGSNNITSWNLDDFVVDLIPNCTSPEKHSVTVSNITDNEATISWEDDDQNHNTWCVFYKPTTSNGGWQVDTVYDAQTLTIGNLNIETTYEVFVITYCGTPAANPDATLHQYFTTTQEPTPIPYSTDFTQNDGWRLNNGSCANYWVIGNYAPTGNHHALFVTTNGLAPGYDVNEPSIISAEKCFTVGQHTQVQVDFDINIGGENSETWDYDYMKMFLATSSEVFGAYTTTMPFWAEPTYSTHAYNFTPYLSQSGSNAGTPYDFSQTGGNTIHITAVMSNPNTNPTPNSIAKLVFVWINDETMGTQPSVIITNLAVTPVACPQPTDLTVENIGAAEADVYWIPGESETHWNLEYKKANVNYWVVVPTTSNTCHLSGLTANTLYDLRLQSDCETESSQYLVSSFTTTSCSASEQCTYTFHLNDAYGDGWNGASISVMQNGTLSTTISLSETNSADVNITLCNNSSITLVWNMGMYDYECSFSLTGPDGTLLYSNPNLDTISQTTLFTFTTDCSSTPVCDAPEDLTANNITTSEAILSWPAGDAEAWIIEYRPTNSLSWEPAVYTIQNNKTLTGLLSNTTYQVHIKSKCTSEIWSDWSDFIIFTTPVDSASFVEPTVVTNSASAITYNSATLNGAITNLGNQTIVNRGFEWKASGDTDYTTVDAANAGTVFSATLTDLTPNTEYTFRAFVTSVNTTNYGEVMTFTTPEVITCETPTDLDTVSVANDYFTIRWTDNAGASHWKVRYRTQEGTWTTENASVTTHTIAGLAGLTTYFVQVQAVCSTLSSEWSNMLVVTTKNVGIDEHLLSTIKLYPNPTSDEINMEWGMDYEITTIEVFDVYGKLIRTVATENDNLPSQTARINVSGLSSGMYFVRFTTNNGVATKSFVKK
jgi:hypothetical protein